MVNNFFYMITHTAFINWLVLVFNCTDQAVLRQDGLSWIKPLQ